MKWLRELNERDRDLYESDLAEERAQLVIENTHGVNVYDRVFEGYDADLDDAGERAEDRQRLIEGTE